MGHRANYVVRQNGRVELFYSHWGALHILRDLFWGPDAAARMVHASEPADGLLDDVWCEGAALVDHDARRLLVFGGDSGWGDEQRRLFLDLFDLTWPGWQVEYAAGGIAQIAAEVGIDPAPLLLASQYDDPPPDTLRPFDPEEDYAATLVTVREPGGWTDRLPGTDALSLLAIGPALIDRLADLPTVDPLVSEVREYVASGVVIDPGEQEVQFFRNSARWRPEEQVAPLWPGWSVRQHQEGLRFHFTATNRTPPPPDPGVADRLLEYLAGKEFDGVELVKQVMEHLKQDKSGDMQVNPSALEHAKAEVGITRKADTLRRAAARLGRPLPTDRRPDSPGDGADPG